jgi:ribosome assembly protein RRB1
MLAVAGADDQVTIWDLSVEADDDGTTEETDRALAALPPQLLFVHQGQRDVKELHFHPQLPGVLMTSAVDGFNVFKPAITVGP